MTSITARPGDDASAESRGIRRLLPRHWILWTLAAVAVAASVAGVYAWRQYRTLTSAKFNVINYTVPAAPHLVAGSGEKIYRIDPTASHVSYAVDEKLFGHSAHRAEGTTNGIAGDIALNAAHPAATRVGQIVVNVEQLHSDNNLRDARMRADNLESHDHPLVDLSVTGLSGMPSSIAEGTSYHFTMSSSLTVKGTRAPVSWDVNASLAGGKLTASATTKVKMSKLGIGPISIAGLVSTSDDVTLTMQLTALDPSKFAIPTAIAAPASAPRVKDSPSFASVIMPALQANCASCHNPGEVGAAHWSLETAADAAKISDGIGSVVDAGYMPPWPASPHGVALMNSKRLDQPTIDAIVKWAHAGGPLDVSATTRITPKGGPPVPAPRRDVVLPMPEAYAGSLSVPNDYRCFVLDPKVTKKTYLTGYSVTPDKRAEIHHVQLFQIDKSQVVEGRKISGADGKPGWSCYGTVELRSTERHNPLRHEVPGFTGQAGLIAGWVPGQDPVIFPNHSGIMMLPGDALVLQVHYHYDSTPVPDRTSVAIQTDPGSAKFKTIDIINPIAPVEIPCMPGQASAPLCDRNAALADDVRLYGGIGAGAESGLLGLCGKQYTDLAATFHNGIASSSCEYTVAESGTIVSVFGHEHTLGKTFRMTLDPGTPNSKMLLDIPTWNFSWQMNYGLAKPLHVNAGQKIRMDCSWDRSIEPNRSPKYIVFAEGTEDEMCFGTYAIIPDGQ
ncbi:MAG TPA: YceI family protein [Acidimicrobiia bacterium]|nr:YceI family protein [Acidimicrobiia bacterium]